MSNLSTYFPKINDFNQGGDSVFENIYIWGKSYFDDDITIGHEALFLDEVEFKDDVTFLNILVNNRLDVGFGKTILTVDTSLEKVGIFQPEPIQPIHIKSIGSNNLDIVVTGLGTIGIGTTNPGNFDLSPITREAFLTLGNGDTYSFTANDKVTQDGNTTVGFVKYETNNVGFVTLNNVVGTFSTYQDGTFGLGELKVDGVGIGKTPLEADHYEGEPIEQGPLRLDIDGSVSIGRNIYDSAGSPGPNGAFLNRDERGIRWVTFEPAFSEGIFIQDEGVYISNDPLNPTVGAAQSFTAINFRQINSAGLGSDTLKPIADVGNPNEIVRVQTQDLWGYYEIEAGLSTVSIYRMSRVGIGSSAPYHRLQVGTSGTDFVVTDTGLVGIGSTSPQATLNVDGTVIVTGVSTFQSDVIASSTLTVGDPGNITGGAPTDEGVLAVYTEGTKNALIIQTSDNSNSRGIAFRNKGDAYVGYISIEQNTGNVGDMVFGVNASTNSNVDNIKERLRITKDGNVGIGSTSPIATLDVDGQTELDDLNVSGITTSGTLAVVGLTTTKNLTVHGLSQTVNLKVSGVSTFVGISTFGIVGIGTDDPIIRVNSGVTASSIAAQTETINLDASELIAGQAIIPIDDIIDEGTEIESIDVNGLEITLNKPTLNTEEVTNQLLEFAVNRGTILTVSGNSDFQGITTFFDDANFKDDINVDGIAKFNNDQESTNTTTGSVVIAGGVGIAKTLNVGKKVLIEETSESTSFDTGALIVSGGIGIAKSSTFGSHVTTVGNLGITSTLSDKNNNIGEAGKDYRLSSVGTGVSWRPPGVQTQNTIWVSKDGDDNNSGLLEGDSKATVGGAAAIAGPSDTIIIRPGVYVENNPIGLRTDVSIHGQDIRLVTIVPSNPNDDVFHVRRGCLVENINFAGQSQTTDHTGCGAIAFPPTQEAIDAEIDVGARSGYTDPGPINQGPSLRWRSPYIRNCTNFMTSSIGMKINGDYANASFTGINSVGQDLKSMVCDSFTQYNENGIGVSLTNKAYAQLVSIFTINNDISIYADSGGACDLTNSNTSFGNFGLVAKGVSPDEYTATLKGYNDPLSSLNVDGDFPGELDNIIVQSLEDVDGNARKPYDGQGVYFKVNLGDYNDTTATGITTEPFRIITGVKITNGGSGYNNLTPPTVTVNSPLGPESIPAELSANIDEDGSVESIDVISSGRNFLPPGNNTYEQNIVLTISSPTNPSGTQATAEAIATPVYFTVTEGSEATGNNKVSEITFNEFIPYSIAANTDVVFRRLSRIITSSHTFEYVGTGTDINRANPFQGGIPIPENEIVATEGANIPFTSTDQKGNFRIGEGVIIDQTSSTVRGTQFTKSIQANVTPLILALGGS